MAENDAPSHKFTSAIATKAIPIQRCGQSKAAHSTNFEPKVGFGNSQLETLARPTTETAARSWYFSATGQT
ncbi:MAG TPA: hypothetical protein VMT08_00345 [Bradyrhizobium sp.]|nr:hypothetical protein [Bradyrhizobium sp.]